MADQETDRDTDRDTNKDTNRTAYRLLKILLVEAAVFLFWLILAPRLSAEGMLYRGVTPVPSEAARGGRDTAGYYTSYAGYPSSSPPDRIGSADELRRNYIAALQIDGSQLKATGIYKQVGHRPGSDSQNSRYSMSSTTYGITAPAVARSRWTVFWMKPWADYAQYYILTFEDGSRTWALIDDAITKTPSRGTIELPWGYYWDQGANHYLTEKEKKRYMVWDDADLDDCIDLCGGWLQGAELEQYRETSSFVQSAGLALTGILFLITFIIFLLPGRRGKRK